ncbi:hypothetical protein D3M61_07305 [Aliarcobacter butzleri]|uniref:hypothetical protein n=1 Tax=Aliarcobacter butzleri TaxID=28197 RepID=UPI00102D952E|nr:hypothetical protein [Aliarcobacter butzleri]RZV13682.1 hypothetical protein D3M61_07305 [Aliarcobacter butzleri]
MLKALEILKAYARCREEERILMYPLKEVKEAIAELEVLENRKCDNCLYFSNSGHGFGLCNKGVSSDFKIGTFYCNKWEVKNES